MAKNATTNRTMFSKIAMLAALGPINAGGHPPDDDLSAIESLNEAVQQDRTCELIGNAIDELHDEGKRLLKIDAGTRTVTQNKRVDTILTKMRELRNEYRERELFEKQVDERARQISNAINRPACSDSTWRDSAGRAVNVLKADQRVLDRINRSHDHRGDPSPGNLIRGMITGNWDNAEVEREFYNLSTTAGSGVMVPETIGAMLIDLARAGSAVMRAGAQTVAMTAPKMSLVKVTSDPSIAAYAENADIAESDPGIEGVEFVAKKLAVLVRVSRECCTTVRTLGR